MVAQITWKASFNPLSTENIQARQSFKTLNLWHKIGTIAAVALLGCTVIGLVFCTPAFRKLVDRFKTYEQLSGPTKAQADKVDDVANKALETKFAVPPAMEAPQADQVEEPKTESQENNLQKSTLAEQPEVADEGHGTESLGALVEKRSKKFCSKNPGMQYQLNRRNLESSPNEGSLGIWIMPRQTTSCYNLMVKEMYSVKEELDIRGPILTNDASVLAVKMGFRPADVQVLKMENSFGINAYERLQPLHEIADLEELKQFFDEDPSSKVNVKFLLKLTNPTDEEIFEKLDILRELIEEKESRITGEFVPRLLHSLKVQNPMFSVGSYPLEMSEEGDAKWKEAIASGIDFCGFDRFEHIRPYMTEAQIIILDELLAR